jgi:hypothetical protein
LLKGTLAGDFYHHGQRTDRSIPTGPSTHPQNTREDHHEHGKGEPFAHVYGLQDVGYDRFYDDVAQGNQTCSTQAESISERRMGGMAEIRGPMLGI